MASQSNQAAEAKSSRAGRDAAATKQAILDAAEAEFSRHGLQGARISAIAKGAGVTTAMIHYYFDNKEGLYRAVLHRPALETDAAIARLQLQDLPPEDALVAFVRAAITYEALHPQRGMLWFQEANQNRGNYFKLTQDSWAAVQQYLLDILERGIAEGVFRPLNLQLTTVHILGICIFYFNIHENWKHLVPEIDRLSSEQIDAHIDAAVALILAGVRA